MLVFYNNNKEYLHYLGSFCATKVEGIVVCRKYCNVTVNELCSQLSVLLYVLLREFQAQLLLETVLDCIILPWPWLCSA